MRITYKAAISEDGYLARVDGDVSWLDNLDIDLGLDTSAAGLEAFIASVDGLVMGRNTYDFVHEYGVWPYQDKPTWVCTSRELDPLPGANLTRTRSLGELSDLLNAAGLKHLWLVGGGRLASSMLTRNMITHLSLDRMPICLGAGIPVFASHSLDELAAQSRGEQTLGGFTQINMQLKRQSPSP